MFKNSVRTLNSLGHQNWGGKIRGSGGQTFLLAEQQYSVISGSEHLGGSATRLVLDNLNRSLSDNAFIIIDTCELEFEGIVVQGFWDPYSVETIASAPEDFPPIGILIKNNYAEKVGMGKLHALALTIIACQDAIVCGEGNDDDNADQLFIGELHTYYCTTGIKLRDPRSVGHHIAQYEGVYVDTMLEIEQGGKVHGGQWTLIQREGVLIRISGNVDANAAVIIDHVIVDAGVEREGGTDARIIEMEQGGAFTCTIGKLTVDPTLVMKDAFRLRGYAQVDILSGSRLRNEMIRAYSNVGGEPLYTLYRPHITVSNCTFDEGQSPYNLISTSGGTTSAGFVIEVKGCRSALGVPFPDRKWSRDNSGVITVHYHDSPTIISTANGGAYVLTAAFAQFTFSGGSPVNPTLTLNPPGSTWRIILYQHLYFNNATLVLQ